jgi:hypothetical protein
LSGTSAKTDHFAIWPTVLACCFPLIWVALWSGPFDLAFAGEFGLYVTWAWSALLALVFAIFSASTHLWWRAASLSILPLVTLVVIANAGTAETLAMETGERIHFQAMRRSYLADVSKLPSSGEPRFAMWIWGGFVIGHGVIYDESDEIVLPVKSPTWKKRVANTEVVECGAWGTPLGNHFYLVRTGC